MNGKLGLFLLGDKKGLAVIVPVLAVVGILFAFPRPGTILVVEVLAVAVSISAFYEGTREITKDRLLALEVSLRDSNAALQKANAESLRLAGAAALSQVSGTERCHDIGINLTIE